MSKLPGHHHYVGGYHDRQDHCGRHDRHGHRDRCDRHDRRDRHGHRDDLRHYLFDLDVVLSKDLLFGNVRDAYRREYVEQVPEFIVRKQLFPIWKNKITTVTLTV